MREQTQTIRLSKGIRPLIGAARNTEMLTRLVGLRPDNERLVPSRTLTYPIPSTEGEDAGFPYPQLHVCQRYTFLCTATEIYQVNDDWELTSLWGGLTAHKTWHVADFAEFVVFTNGLVTLCFPEESGELAEITCFQYW